MPAVDKAVPLGMASSADYAFLFLRSKRGVEVRKKE